MSVIHSRSSWGPRYSNGFSIIGIQEWLSAGKELWLHHSITNAPGPDASFEQDCAHMREIEAIGQNRFGGGISYTVIVMPSGRAFWGHDLDRQGSHTYQRNNRSRAICLAGNFDVAALPDRMANTVAEVLRELGATLDGGHRDVYPTACPGRYAYGRIGEINNAAVLGNPIGGAPTGGAPQEEEDEMSKLCRGADRGDIYIVTVQPDGSAEKIYIGDPNVVAVLELGLGATKTYDQWKIDYIPLGDGVAQPFDLQALINSLVPPLVAAVREADQNGLNEEETIVAVQKALRRGTDS